jgi:hypothetical protein
VNLPPASASYQVLASESGSNVSSFALQYDGPDCGCFNFTLSNTDTNNPGTTTAWSPAAKLGVWTLLTGVYDAVSGHALIYVNGQLAGTSTGTLTAPWKAAGQFEIGRTLWNGSFSSYTTGSLADVQVWQRVLYPPEIQALADPSSNGLVEANSFEQPGSGAAQTVEFAAPDPHNLLHDLLLQGTAQVPLSGAGYQGLGLQLDGNGYADSSIDEVNNGTPDQVLHTDQSFTVSSWVRLPSGTSLPTQTMTALSQEGSAASGFFLGYRTSGTAGFWSFAMPGADSTSSSGWAEADSANLSTTALGVWTQIKGVFDAGAGTMTLYVNGQQAARVTRTATPWDSTGSFVVGADGPASNLAHMWVGDIDEIRAYQGILTVPAGDWQFGSFHRRRVDPDADSADGRTARHRVPVWQQQELLRAAVQR